MDLKVKMAANHKNYIRNELPNPKIVEIDVLHKIVAQTVQKIQIMAIFKIMVGGHLGFEGQNGCQSSKIPSE